MSATPDRQPRLGPGDIRARKGQAPVVCLTAYTTPMARLVDRHCDLVLVGDSVGMVMHGLPSTLGVTMEMMILHGQAVARGVSQACMVVDMPFGSYEGSPQQAFDNAARLLKETGAAAVKVEGGKVLAPTIEFLTQRGIPVMGHVGLTPQAVNILGGYGVRGKSEEEARSIVEDAVAVAQAGAFSIVIEGVLESIAIEITNKVDCPTIGIGASAQCDGQVLVTDDMLGMFERVPKFVKRYQDMGAVVSGAVKDYADEVRSRSFPTGDQIYEG